MRHEDLLRVDADLHDRRSGVGRDSVEMLRDRHIFCKQFVIEGPDPGLLWDSTQYCCGMANRVHDCHAQDWEEKYR
jgi:hypothetical protein